MYTIQRYATYLEDVPILIYISDQCINKGFQKRCKKADLVEKPTHKYNID